MKSIIIKAFILTLTFSSLIFNCGFAQNLNLDDLIKSALLKTDKLTKIVAKEKGAVPLPPGGSFAQNITRGIFAAQELTYESTSQYEIQNIDFTIDGGSIRPDPSQSATQSVVPISYKFLIVNCDNNVLPVNLSYNITWKNSQTITVTNQFTTAKNTSYAVKVDLDFKVLGVGTKIEASFAQALNVTAQNTEQKQQTNSTDETSTVGFPNIMTDAHRAKIVKIDFSLKKDRVPFDAVFFVNGKVTLQLVQTKKNFSKGNFIGSDRAGQSTETIALKDLLSDSLRTFKLSGFLDLSHANNFDIHASQSGVTLSDSAQVCESQKEELIRDIDNYNNKNTNGEIKISPQSTPVSVDKNAENTFIKKVKADMISLHSKNSNFKLININDIKQDNVTKEEHVNTMQDWRNGNIQYKTIEPTPCPICNTSGTCQHCNGTGYFTCPTCNSTGIITKTCNYCGGSGNIEGAPCPVCNGNGHTEEKCNVCNGAGKFDCNRCNTSGRCSNCNGSGYIYDK